MIWFYELPVWVSLPLFVIVFLALSWGVLLLLRPWVRRMAGRNEEWDRVLGYAMASYGVFYGILLALIAVSVYDDFSRVDGVVLEEASALATLYRDVSAYPAPYSYELQDLLRGYTQNVIAIDWPSQAQGLIPGAGNGQVDAIQRLLFSFNPSTSGEQAYHLETLERFNDLVEARRDRLDETQLALPGLLWALLGVGAVLNAAMLALVEAKNLRIHLIMSGIIAVFVAMLIYVTASMDHPYSGAVNITPEPFRVLLEQVMTK